MLPSWLLMLLLCCYCRLLVVSDTVQTAQRAALKNYLFNKCPALTSTDMPRDSMDIFVNLSLDKFIDISDVDQVFSNLVTFSFTWELPCASWSNASDLSVLPAWRNIAFISLNSSNMYIPRIVSANNQADMNALKNMLQDWDFILFANGTVLGLAIGRIDTTCDLNFITYPYDDQNCTIEIEPFYPQSTIIPTGMSMFNGIEGYISDAELWEFLGMGFYSTTSQPSVIFLGDGLPHSRAVFWVHLKRRVDFYFSGILVPYTCLTCLMLPVLLLEPKDPNRAIYSVTLMFAFAVLQSAIMQNLPETSEGVWLIRAVDARVAAGSFITVYCLFSAWFARLDKFNVKLPCTRDGNDKVDHNNKPTTTTTTKIKKVAPVPVVTNEIATKLSDPHEINDAESGMEGSYSSLANNKAKSKQNWTKVRVAELVTDDWRKKSEQVVEMKKKEKVMESREGEKKGRQVEESKSAKIRRDIGVRQVAAIFGERNLNDEKIIRSDDDSSSSSNDENNKKAAHDREQERATMRKIKTQFIGSKILNFREISVVRILDFCVFVIIGSFLILLLIAPINLRLVGL